MTVDKGLTRWECSDCGRVGYTTTTDINALHPKFSHHKGYNRATGQDEICVPAGLRGLLYDAEKQDTNIVHIVSLRRRIAELS
jgi:hypothetical protein